MVKLYFISYEWVIEIELLRFQENLFSIFSCSERCQIGLIITGSTNSSQTGGYYSSGSSLGLQSSYTTSNNHLSVPPHSPGNRRKSITAKQSVSSRTPSLDEEDDGFYDNIQVSFSLIVFR